MKATPNTAERSQRTAWGTRILALAGGLLAFAFLTTLYLGSPAHADPRAGTQTSSPLCTRGVPDAYKSLDTIAGCTTTTTVPASNGFTLTISYDAGTVRWRACGSQGLAGTTVQLYIDGQAMTANNGSATVQSNGCTAPSDLQMCLAPGDHTGTATDGPNQASKSFNVSSSGCPNPQLLSGSGGVGAHSTRSRSLAFTGVNVVLMLVAAGLLLTLGISAVRLAKQRR